MTRIVLSLHAGILSAACAHAQNAHDAAPTSFTEPASDTAVLVFLVMLIGAIGAFGLLNLVSRQEAEAY